MSFLKTISRVQTYPYFLGFVWIFFTSCAQNKKLPVDYTFESATSTNDLKFEEIPFEKNDDLDLGFYRGNIWIKLQIKNSNSFQSLMFINNDLFNSNYTFFKQNLEKGSFEEIRNNNSPYDNRSFKDPNPNFKIDLQANEKATFIIKSSSDGRTTNASPSLITLGEYNSLVNQNSIGSIVFLSIILILIVLNLYLWQLHQDRIYVFYIFYMVTSLIMYAGFDGLFYSFGLSLQIIDHTIFLLVRIWVLTLILFTTKFLDIKKTNPKFYNFSILALGLILGINTLYQFLFYKTSIQYLHYYENTLSFLYLLLIFAFVILSAKNRKLELRYYLIALSFFLTFVILGLVDGHLNVFPGTPFIYIKLGTLIEFVGFTYFMTILIKQRLSSATELEKQLHETTEELEQKNLLLSSKKGIDKSDLVGITKLIENTLSSEEDWEAFILKFKELNPKFLEQILSDFPDLTKSEIRLLILIKVGYSQKEIAEILAIAPDSVKKARTRIRKKLTIYNQTELSDFLNQY